MGVLRVELKRVVKARMTWVLLGLALLLSAVLAYLPVTYCSSTYLDENGKEVTVTGRASIACEKARQAETAGPVTPERIRAALERYQVCLRQYGVTESYDLPEGVYEQEILPIAPLLHGVKEAFADPNTGMAPSLWASGVGIQTSILYALTDFRFLNLGGLTLWVPWGMLLAWAVEIPLFLVLTVRSYCKTAH